MPKKQKYRDILDLKQDLEQMTNKTNNLKYREKRLNLKRLQPQKTKGD